MKKVLLLATTLFVCGATASAQFMGGSYASSAGSADGFSAAWITYAPTTFKYSDDGYSTSVDDFKTFSVGYTKAAPILNLSLPLLYEFGAVLDWTRYSESEKEDGISVKDVFTLVGVKVPLNILCRLNLTPDLAVYPFAGLHAKGYVFGQVKATAKYDDGESESETINLFSSDDMDGDEFKRFGAGYQLGLRLGYSKYFAAIGYEASLTDLADHVKTHMTTISLGIQF